MMCSEMSKPGSNPFTWMVRCICSHTVKYVEIGLEHAQIATCLDRIGTCSDKIGPCSHKTGPRLDSIGVEVYVSSDDVQMLVEQITMEVVHTWSNSLKCFVNILETRFS